METADYGSVSGGRSSVGAEGAESERAESIMRGLAVRAGRGQDDDESAGGDEAKRELQTPY